MPTDFRGSALRVEEHLRALARCSASPSGITRLYLTPEHRAANGLVSGWMQEAGLEPRVDETGTVIGRREGS
ncbi:MAG: Zn-dependent hydrolase, partial [Sutterellaceae bacterium]|nr:Zn-dependent hydrolase [Sutterellaceae bacterium]